jgi:signal transduction histidine kinase
MRVEDMAFRSERVYSLEKPTIFISALLVSFLVVFGVACWIAYDTYQNAIIRTIRSNGVRANLLAKIILEHQRATIGVIRSYGNRPLLVDAVRNKDFEEAFFHLSSLVKNNPEVEMAFITNPGGTLWANFPIFKEVFKQNFSNREWYKGLTKEWAPYVSGVYKMIVGEKELAVSVCCPIRDERGKVIGILAATQTTVFFQKIINEIGLDADVKITLIDQDRHIIYSNRFLYKKEVSDYPSFWFVRKVMEGEKGDVEIRDYSDGNKSKYMSFAPIQDIGWSVVVEKGKAEVFRSEFRYFILIVAVSSLVFILILFFLVYLRQRHRQIAALRESGSRLRHLASQLLSAQEQERKRIAHELHDSVGASLSAVRFKIENAIHQVKQGDPTAEFLKTLLPSIQQTVEESRRIQANLRPSMLDDLGVLPTIEWFCREFQKMYSHIRIEKCIDLAEDKVPDPLKTVIYRISQEALNNVAKHSQADLVILSLQKKADLIELVIQDNGQGFNVEETLSKENYKRGLGISSMRERAELSGGSFTIESSAGKGTTLRVSWPLREDG